MNRDWLESIGDVVVLLVSVLVCLFGVKYTGHSGVSV